MCCPSNGCRGCMKKLTTVLMLNNTEIQLEIDTGAELLTISISVYREKLSKGKLEPSTQSVCASMMALPYQ